MRRTARDKLIVAAEAEMLAKGYPGTTVDEICERAGVSKGSFYHFFASKEELGLAVLDAFQERNRKIVEALPADGAGTPEHALALVDHFIASAGALWGGGCLIGSFALDLAETNPTIADAVSDKFRDIQVMLTRSFAPLVEGHQETALTPAELAEQFVVSVEGALILARAHHDWSYVERALDRFRAQVRASQGVGA